MARPSRAADPDKGAAARAETKADPDRSIDFRGMPLTLPERLPAAVLFDLGLIDEGDIAGTMRLLDSLLGREQFLAVRRKVTEEGLDVDSFAEPLGRLVQDAFGAFGMAPGEAQASSGS